MDVVAWRLCRLREAGFTPSLAASLAVMQIDLHALLQLVDRGCPPELAARILSPFDDRHTVVDPARSDGIEMASGAGESARSR